MVVAGLLRMLNTQVGFNRLPLVRRGFQPPAGPGVRNNPATVINPRRGSSSGFQPGAGSDDGNLINRLTLIDLG
jgi:hypothetical protein